MGFWQMIIHGSSPDTGVGSANAYMVNAVSELEAAGHSVHSAQTVSMADPAPQPEGPAPAEPAPEEAPA